MEKREVFFLDKEGRKISGYNLKFHSQLAKKLIEQDEELKEKYEQSGVEDMTMFLLEYFYCAGVNSSRYKEISFLPRSITEKQKKSISILFL